MAVLISKVEVGGLSCEVCSVGLLAGHHGAPVPSPPRCVEGASRLCHTHRRLGLLWRSQFDVLVVPILLPI